MAGNYDDWQEKYTALLQERSVLKAQNSVLKKAVLEEQTLTKTLQNQLKAKEQRLKESANQLDLMTYHNDTLTKRIESLREEMKTSKSSFRSKYIVRDERADILSAELANKIDENERLHRKVTDLAHNNEMLVAQVEDLERNYQGLLEKLNETEKEKDRQKMVNRRLDEDFRRTLEELRIVRNQQRSNLLTLTSSMSEIVGAIAGITTSVGNIDEDFDELAFDRIYRNTLSADFSKWTWESDLEKRITQMLRYQSAFIQQYPVAANYMEPVVFSISGSTHSPHTFQQSLKLLTNLHVGHLTYFTEMAAEHNSMWNDLIIQDLEHCVTALEKIYSWIEVLDLYRHWLAKLSSDQPMRDPKAYPVLAVLSSSEADLPKLQQPDQISTSLKLVENCLQIFLFEAEQRHGGRLQLELSKLRHMDEVDSLTGDLGGSRHELEQLATHHRMLQTDNELIMEENKALKLKFHELEALKNKTRVDVACDTSEDILDPEEDINALEQKLEGADTQVLWTKAEVRINKMLIEILKYAYAGC
ncbi:hypothetical protein HK102_003587 [Quaeritorhiza haematococci]|nr:hypothetical protein HK102_003587 [Quaeritorhiza haematococci]